MRADRALDDRSLTCRGWTQAIALASVLNRPGDLQCLDGCAYRLFEVSEVLGAPAMRSHGQRPAVPVDDPYRLAQLQRHDPGRAQARSQSRLPVPRPDLRHEKISIRPSGGGAHISDATITLRLTCPAHRSDTVTFELDTEARQPINSAGRFDLRASFGADRSADLVLRNAGRNVHSPRRRARNGFVQRAQSQARPLPSQACGIRRTRLTRPACAWLNRSPRLPCPPA
jgi:hypothetical protein